jgi:phage terminase small subunit
MAPRGRPPKPIEQKRRTGRTPDTDSGGRKLTPANAVIALPLATGIPEPPADFGLDARRLWVRAWDSAITWLSPHSDMESVEQACRLVEDIAIARERYRATHDPGDLRALVAVQKLMQDSLSLLGFDPTSRSRLGLAEVKAASTLDKIAARRAERQQG